MLLERVARGKARFHETGRRDARPPRFHLRRVRNPLAAIAACGLPPLLGFVVPALVLIELLIASGGPTRDFDRHLFNSLMLAGVAAIVVTAGALLLAYARKERPKALAGKAALFASFGYAVPGSVVAVGVLTPFAAFDNAVSSLSERLFGVPTGLVLTGGIAALIFAYLVLYLAVALQSVGAGLERVTPSISAAARLLARGPFDALKTRPSAADHAERTDRGSCSSSST